LTFALSHRESAVPVGFSLLALLALLALTLSGCGGAQPPEPAAAATPVEQTAPADNPPEPPAQAQNASSPADVNDIEIPADAPVEPLQVSAEFAPSKAAGSVEGVPAATNTAPIVAIANYYADLPGIDMSSLTPAQREKFLHRANSELCTCGCKDDTLAKCYMNDESCTTVREILKQVLAEVRSGG